MSHSELQKLQDKRKDIVAELEAVDAQILEVKRARQAELLSELKALGLDDQPKRVTRTRDPDKPCPVCGQKGHDARRHKKDKKAS